MLSVETERLVTLDEDGRAEEAKVPVLELTTVDDATKDSEDPELPVKLGVAVDDSALLLPAVEVVDGVLTI